MITIDGVALPTPKSYKVTKYDITKSERNANAKMIMERVAKKTKIELFWSHIERTTLANLLTQLGSKVFFTVSYIDPETGTFSTGTFYAGDKSVDALDYVNGVIRWKDVKFNIIEQ